MKNVRIGPKLIISFLFTAALSAFVGIYLIIELKTLSAQTATIYERGAVPLGFIIKTANDMQEMRVQVRNWWMATTPEKRAATLKIIDEKRAALKQSLDEQKNLVLTEKGKVVLEEAKLKIDEFVDETYNYTSSVKKFDVMGNPLDGGLPQSVLKAGDAMTEIIENVGQTRINAVKDISENTLGLAASSQKVAVVILATVLLLSLGLGIFLTISITRPLNVVVNTISKMEKGDMTVRAGLTRGDELGILSTALDSLSTRMQGILGNLQQNSETLAGSAEQLSSIGRQVTNTTEKVTVNINQMASTATQASANANEVAGTAEEMSTNMNMMAAAVEEMSASINQIASNTIAANKIANEAAVKSREATEAMNRLGAAAKEIGQVTDVIKRIAEKTNLLALNATIEAASAGPAGKGFAVVAGEIKELANQSAQSADDIAHRIEGIQSGTGNAVKVISDVSQIIAQINHSVEVISTHVDQQTKASNEIANNVAQVNVGAKRVAGAIGEVAKGNKDMARNAEVVAKDSISALDTRQINQGAEELAMLASNIKSVLNNFEI